MKFAHNLIEIGRRILGLKKHPQSPRVRRHKRLTVEPLGERIMLAGDIDVSYLDDDATQVTVDNGGTAAFETSANSFEFNITNDEAAIDDLDVSELEFDGDITSVSFSPILLMPGESTSITVDFPGASSGAFTGTVTITSDDSDDNPFTFTIDVQTPPPDISASFWDSDGTVTNLTDSGGTIDIVSSNTSIDFEIRNDATDGDLNLSGVSFDGDVVDVLFTPTILSPGSSTTITVAFDSTNPGPFTGSVEIISNDPDENPFTFYVNLELPPPDITVSYSDPDESVTDLTATGGTFDIDSPDTSLDFELRNDATEGDLIITAITYGGQVTSATVGAMIISPESSTTLTVYFDTTIVGPYTAWVVIDSNDPDDNSFLFHINLSDSSGSDPDPPVVDTINLTNDTGSDNWDWITNDPTVTGWTSWDSPDFTNVYVEFDHHGDGTVDGSSAVDPIDGTFAYNPLDFESALNSWDDLLTLRFRAVGQTIAGDVAGDWNDVAFLLDRVAPVAVTVTPSGGFEFDPSAGHIEATFNEEIDPTTVDSSTFWAESIETASVPSQSTSVAGNIASIQFSNPLEFDEQWYQTIIQGIADVAGNVAPNDLHFWQNSLATGGPDSPFFNVDGFNGEVIEQAAPGTLVGNINDVTNPTTEPLTFAITAGDPDGKFSIDSAGNIFVAGDLDYETIPSFDLLVETRTPYGYDTAFLTVVLGNVVSSVALASSDLIQGDTVVASLAVTTDRGSLAGFTARIKVEGDDVLALRHLDGTPLIPSGQTWVDFPIENLPSQILVEGTEEGAADLLLLAVGPAMTMQNDSDGSSINVSGLIDIDIDVNNSASITAADDPQNNPSFEKTGTGKEVVIGQLVELKVTDNTRAAHAGYKLTFLILGGTDHVKIWEDQNKTTIVTDANTTKEYIVGTNVPNKVYVEGISSGTNSIIAVLSDTTGTQGASDEVKVTSVTKNVVATTFDYDVEPTKSTMQPYGNQFTWTMIFNEAARNLFAYQLINTKIVGKDAQQNVVHTLTSTIIDLLPLDVQIPGVPPFLQDRQDSSVYGDELKKWVNEDGVKSIEFTRTGDLQLSDRIQVKMPNGAIVDYDPTIHGMGLLFGEIVIDDNVNNRYATTTATRVAPPVEHAAPIIDSVVSVSQAATTYRVTWQESISTQVKVSNDKYYYAYGGILTWDFREKATLNGNVNNGIDRNYSAPLRLRWVN